MWDPVQYLNFSDERSRPFFDLVGRIRSAAPELVVDLGCGPGNLTAALADRWPAAEIQGIDSSPEMIAAADQMLKEAAARGPSDQPGSVYGQPSAPAGRLTFQVGDVSDWEPDDPADVIVSNAVLQWVPGHLELLPRWADFLAADGWLAFQVPGNLSQPVHAILRKQAASDKWRPLLAGVELNRQAGEPAQYLDLLAGLGLAVDAWETTYLHVLPGPDPVTQWYKGTGMRPVLAALDPANAEEFVIEYSARVRAVYPAARYGTVLPFRRVFVVAHKR